MRLVLILISFLLVAACSKRTVDLQAVKTSTRLDTKIDSSSLVQLSKTNNSYVVSFEDSENEYWVNITPDTGTVTFNQLTGFVGKAKSVTIHGKQKKSLKSALTTQNKIDSNAKINVSKGISVKNDMVIKNKQSESKRYNFMGVLTVISIFVVAIAAIYLFLRYKSRS